MTEFYNSPGYSNEDFYLFLGEDLVPEKGESEEDEFLKIEKIPLDKAVSLIRDGKIVDAKSIIGLTLTKLYLLGLFQIYGTK